jgi:uracil-DNA glycosylase
MTFKVVLCGEAWGKHEDMFKHAFVGTTGRELITMIDDAGLTDLPFRNNCYGCGKSVNLGRCPNCGEYYKPDARILIKYWDSLEQSNEILTTNVFEEQPPSDNVEYFFGNRTEDVCLDLPPLKAGKYLKKQYLHYLHRLLHEVSEAEPNLIVALGNTASWALLGVTPKITAMRGTITTTKIGGYKLLPTFHPSAVLRNWPLRPTVIADLQKARSHRDSTKVNRTKRWLLKYPTFDEIEEWFSRPATRYAIDIESGYALYTKLELKHMTPQMRYLLASQISMIGFARSKSDSMVISFMDRHKPGLNFYQDPEDEIRAWELTGKSLASPIEKVFQNGVYDVSRLLHFCVRPRNCRHDTMLKHHALFSEMQKSLGYMASIHMDEIGWKQMYGQGDSLKRDE